MRMEKRLVVDKPLKVVYDFLSDFTTTEAWDPGTVTTVRERGDGGVGTAYLNTSRFLGRETKLTYVVEERAENQRIALRGENETVIAHDTMDFRSTDGGTEVTYTAEFEFKGVTRFVAPLLRPALLRLGAKAETGIREALLKL